MRGLTEDCGFQDRPVVIGKIEIGEKERGTGLEDQNRDITKELDQESCRDDKGSNLKAMRSCD